MAQTLLGDGNVTATGRVRGATVRAPSLTAYEIGTTEKTSDLETEIVSTVNNTIAHRVSGLDPATSSIADVINALKGTN